MSHRWFLIIVGAIIIATIWLRLIPHAPASTAINQPAALPVVPTIVELTPEVGVKGSGSVQLRQAVVGLEMVVTASLPPPLPGLRYGLWVQPSSGEEYRLGDLVEQGWGSYRLAVTQADAPQVHAVIVTIDDGNQLEPGSVVMRGEVAEATRPSIDPVVR